MLLWKGFQHATEITHMTYKWHDEYIFLVGILSKRVTIKNMDHFWLVKNNCNRAIVCESSLFPQFPLSASITIRTKKKQDIDLSPWECQGLWLCCAISPLYCSNQSVSKRCTCWWFPWHVSTVSIQIHNIKEAKQKKKIVMPKLLQLIWFKPDGTLRFYKEGSDSLCAQLHHWACKGLYKQEEFSLDRLYCILIQVWTGHHCYGPFHSLVQRWWHVRRHTSNV